MPIALHAYLAAQAAAGATITTEVGEIPIDPAFGTNNRVARVRITSPALVTGAVTNNATIKVNRYRNGVLQDVAGTITLASGVNLAAATTVDVPVTGSQACMPGDVFEAQQVQNGSGLALPAGIAVQVEVV